MSTFESASNTPLSTASPSGTAPNETRVEPNRGNISEFQDLVIAESLAAGYRDKVVWQGANFSFGRGEFIGIIGPNGSGKTTLFRLLLGLQKPIDGTLKIFGEDPSRGNRRIGYVPQSHNIDSDTNVEALELVRLGISGTKWGFNPFSHMDRDAAYNVLKSVGGSDLAHKPLGALSGGELQRIFLAEAMVGNPDILLLDEPLSNLDMRRETELVHLVDDAVRSRNLTAFLIAHNINPLLPHIDKVIYIANGRVATGKPSEVLTSESLTALYGVEVEVLRDPHGNVAVIGVEEHHGQGGT